MDITLNRPVKEFRLETRNGLLAGLHWQAVETIATTPKIIALHGWLDNAASFKPMAEYLLDCEIIAIDFPGHGHSDWRAGKLWYHLVDYLEDLALLHKHLSNDLSSEHQGWEKFHLLGHSLGGVISGLWAAAMPETLRSLSIIEGLGPLSDTAGENSLRLRKALDSLNKLEDKQLRLFKSIQQAAQTRAKSSAMEIQLAQILVERSLQQAKDEKGNTAWRWSTDPRLMHISPNRYSETQILELLADIQAPSLLLHGDPLPDFVDKEVMQNRIKAAQIEKVVCIKGHHHLHMQHPEITAKHVRNHISRHQ
ncbi:MAG: alpha/beta hydrolase [Xanthomonadales bacterium]|nr:alpha/beta hydrolase [Xanthomonadales bacterium]